MAKRGRPRKKSLTRPQDLVEYHKLPKHWGQVRMWDGKKKRFEFYLDSKKLHETELLTMLESKSKIKGDDVIEIIAYGVTITHPPTQTDDEYFEMTNTEFYDEH